MTPLNACINFNNAEHYFHRNQQYSITAVTDASAAVVDRYAYSAYGTPTITDASGTTRTTTAVGNRYSYTGREYDETLALYHYRARMYDSVVGRFVSRDPIGYQDGLSIYRVYVSLDLVDPTGLRACTPLERRTAMRTICPGQCSNGGMKYKNNGLIHCYRGTYRIGPFVLEHLDVKCDCITSKGCLRSQIDPIYKQMKVHCKVSGCNPNNACDKAECAYSSVRKIEANRCWRHRVKIQKCFSPGDKGWQGHQTQVKEAKLKEKNCGALYAACKAAGTI